MLITPRDTFQDIARYYDPIMDHVDYERWFEVVTHLARLLPERFRHVDAACGTCTLAKLLRRAGWTTVGVDLSLPMLETGRKGAYAPPAAVADLRALPFWGTLDLVTCLFDSMNFLLTMEDVERALGSFYGALRPGGVLYFDVVTERMVTDYYEGQTWVEDNGRFTTTWDNAFDRKSGTIVTKIRVNTGAATDLWERIYAQGDLEKAVGQAGFSLLDVVDAHAWKSPGRKTVRLDFIAVKGDARAFKKGYRQLKPLIRERIEAEG